MHTKTKTNSMSRNVIWWVTASAAAVVLLLTIREGPTESLSHLNGFLVSAPACPCHDNLLCMSLGEALIKNASAPHVQEYIRKSQKKAVS